MIQSTQHSCPTAAVWGNSNPCHSTNHPFDHAGIGGAKEAITSPWLLDKPAVSHKLEVLAAVVLQPKKAVDTTIKPTELPKKLNMVE